MPGGCWIITDLPTAAAAIPIRQMVFWQCARQESNLQLTAYKAGTLTIELRARLPNDTPMPNAV
jgi:hypothetical protein